MQFSIQHNEKQYTDVEIREVIDKYTKSKEKMKSYTKNRYHQYKADLESDDPEKKAEAEAYVQNLKSNARNHYYGGYKAISDQRYKDNKEMLSAKHKYYYYRRNNNMDKFLKADKFKATIEILKNIDSAESKYPELFTEKNIES